MGKDQELLEAARNGNFSVVERILSQRAKRSGPLASLRRGPGANVQDASGYSSLHHAALNGHEDVVQLLLSYEASPNLLDAKGCSPLHLAAWTGNMPIVKLILCHGPIVTNVNLLNSDNETALHCAAQYGHTEVVLLLLEFGCDPTVRNNKQETPLDLAAQYGRLETVESLVRIHPELIASYSTNQIFPNTPLHLASRNGHKAVVELLLGCGMEVNVKTAAGTALHEAALCGKLEVVKLLLGSGVRLSIRDSRNNTVDDLLQQFPSHIVHDIMTLIARQGQRDDNDDELPPIPVPSLGSPYENVRRAPSPSSPNWMDHRRLSTPSSCWDSKRPTWYSSSRVTDGSLVSEDSSCNRDLDQLSISSSSSLGRTSQDIYIPMSPGSRLPPTPPKKPPRRNISISPTNLTMDDPSNLNDGRRDTLRRGKSADQYVDMRPQPVAITATYENVQIRATNPKRKLRRVQTERAGDGLDPASILFRGNLPFHRVNSNDDNGGNPGSPKVNGILHPLSPTNYIQPPTPDHPPPSALQAENSIHQRIRPLSEEYMKRRSKDMETETEEELLLLVYSSPTCNEQHHYLSDKPFAGLLKGSKEEVSAPKAERPKSLRKLRSVYEHGPTQQEQAPTKLLSPFDEQEEWAKISEIMASFGTGLVRESVFVSELEKEFQARLGLNLREKPSSTPVIMTSVGQWLDSIGFKQHEDTFISFGYDDTDFIKGVIDDTDLKDMGISDEDRATILEAAERLRNLVKEVWADGQGGVEGWLSRLRLPQYWSTFKKHFYADLERVRKVWEVELSTVLEISPPGHRHRMMASLPDKPPQPTIKDINNDLSNIKNTIQELEHRSTGTLRHSHKKSRPPPPPPELHIRQPSEILSGITIAKNWKHSASALLSDNVSYHAQYLGSTIVKELRGTESTQKSIQRLKNTDKTPIDVMLVISYRGVKFLDPSTKLKIMLQNLVCEHEIRNIHCACQDSEDLTHFAYITKDFASNAHFCHVFLVETMDLASEIILTLGQAFEVAYQVALREDGRRAEKAETPATCHVNDDSHSKTSDSTDHQNGSATPNHHLPVPHST